MQEKQKLMLGRIILFGHQTEKLKSFYVENFNLSVVHQTGDEWIVLDAGSIELAIHKIVQADDSNPFRAESNTKLVFYLQQDLAGFRQRLIAQGIQMKEIVSFKGFNSLFCDGEDPEGNVFQIEQRL